MSDFSLKLSDLRNASEFGYRRLMRLLKADPPIPCQKVNGIHGGRPFNMYRLSDVLPRLDSHRLFTAEHAANLTKLDQQNRGVTPNVSK